MDRLSQMSDEILASILSCLEIKVAARTCVLSKRWEHLFMEQVWAFNRILNIDGTETFVGAEFDECSRLKLHKQRRSRYIGLVNKVLDSHCRSTIDEFRVNMCFHMSCSGEIDKWIDFAIAKRVQRLDLFLKPQFVEGCEVCEERPKSQYSELCEVCRKKRRHKPRYRNVVEERQNYTFPMKSYIYIKKNPEGLSCINSLRSLSFQYVNISGEILEHFISSCPLLVSLLVKGSKDLVSLKVSGSALGLESLEIVFCHNMRFLEVCATSLVTFKYGGDNTKIDVKIEDAFQLAEVSTFDYSNKPQRHNFFQPSNSVYFSQLETLSIGIVRKDLGSRDFFPEFTKLKHLTLKVQADDFESLLGWTRLIHASPLLNKFKLELFYTFKEVNRRMRTSLKRSHQCLKEVEVVGFVGRLIDVELVEYLITNAVMLEKIIIDPHFADFTEFMTPPPQWMFEETAKTQYAKERAMEIKANLPAGVDMVIL